MPPGRSRPTESPLPACDTHKYACSVSWVVGGVWIGAGAIGVVVLAFCAYEVTWKTHRVQRDLAQLTGLNEQLAAVQRDVQTVQRRIADAADSAG